MKTVQTSTKKHILVIGSTNWNLQHSYFFNKLQTKYSVLFIFDVQEALDRLWHNSYDMLLIEQKFCKRNTIKLSQLSYARSKPSIVLCDNFIMDLVFRFWKRFSSFTRTCCTMRKLMHIYYGINKNLLILIDNILLEEHSHRETITILITKYFN